MQLRLTSRAARNAQARRAVLQRAERRLLGPLLGVPWAAMAALGGLWLLAPTVLERWAYVPLLASVVLLGLPHGALDHLVPGRTGWRWGLRVVPVALYCAAYVALAVAYLWVWTVQPVFAVASFLLLTVLHWGQGDLRFLEMHLGRRRRSRLWALVAVLVRGGVPVVVPLLAFPAAFERLSTLAARVFGAPEPGAWAAPLAPWLTGVCGALLLLYAVDTWRSAAGTKALLAELGEVGLLVGVFALVPAPLAIGVYFCFWHSARHLGRLVLLREGDARRVARGDVVRPAVRLSVELLPITVAALGLLYALYALYAPRVSSVEVFVALYLALIAALTLPHALVVALMDYRPAGRRA